MEQLKQLQGELIAIDTAPFIYFVERHSRYLPVVESLFGRLDQGEFTAVTSTLTLLEVLVHPLRAGNSELAAKYRDILSHARNLRVLPVSDQVAQEAARLRAVHNLKTPDAIQLATSIRAGATFFLTNDATMKGVPEIVTLTLDGLLAGS